MCTDRKPVPGLSKGVVLQHPILRRPPRNQRPLPPPSMKRGRPVKTVARRPVFQYHESMEVQLTFDQEAKLTRMATEQGRAAETLVQEAVERFLNYDEWFSREVDKGLAAADRGEFVEHDDIRKMIDSRYPA